MAKKDNTKQQKTPAPREHVGAAVAEYQEQGAWGGEEISNEDIIIPKILLMQPMSDLVTDGVAKIGEFRDSLNTTRVLGAEKKAVDIIVFGTFKTWLEFKDGEFLSIKRIDHTNSHLALEEVMEDGSVLRRDKTLNFYCLLPGDIAKEEAFPFVLSCRRTSANAGKKINTHITKLKMFNRNSAAKVFALTSYKETNDKGTFFVADIDVSRDSTQEEQAAAYEWYKLLAKSKVRVDESDVTSESMKATAPSEATETSAGAQAVQ